MLRELFYYNSFYIDHALVISLVKDIATSSI